MRNAITLAAVLTLLAAASASAEQAAQADKEMTYTGCVAPGKTPGTFILTNVMMGDGSADKASPRAAEKKEMPKEIMLSSTTVKVDPHQGHQVTVMGPTMMEKAGKMMEMKMMVSSLKMVSTTCK